MSVLVEPGHVTTYPLNHARILWRNVITAVTATGAETNKPAAAALTKTTYERWAPLVSGDSITGTFPEQVVNAVALAAHSDLVPTVEILVGGVWEEVQAFPPDGPTLVSDFAGGNYELLEYSPDNEAVLFLIKPRLCDGVRITVTYSGTAPSLGVLMAGNVLEMHRPLYGGHSPAMLSSESTLQPNVSESGEWLGASLLRQGRSVSMSWDNLPAAWVRREWQPFSDAILTSPYVLAWNPLRASADAIYCSSSERPAPRNTGTRNLQSINLSARGYSDGTTPVVLPLAPSSFDEQYTFQRLSVGTYDDFNGVLQTAAVNEPRFIYDPETGEALGRLNEEGRENILLNSDAPATQSVTVSDATEYTLSVYGPGSAEVTVGGSGVATEGDNLTFTATGTTVEVTVTGGPDYFQLEQGGFATSIIITEGTAVTREADEASRALGAEFNQLEGTLSVFADYKGSDDTLPAVFNLDDSSVNNRVVLLFNSASSLRFIAVGSGVTSVDSTFSRSPGPIRCAVSYGPGGVVLSIDGETVASSPTPIVLAATKLEILQREVGPGGARTLTGVSEFTDYSPWETSAAELNALTAPES